MRWRPTWPRSRHIRKQPAPQQRRHAHRGRQAGREVFRTRELRAVPFRHGVHVSAAANLKDIGTLEAEQRQSPRRPAHRHRCADAAGRLGHGSVSARRLRCHRSPRRSRRTAASRISGTNLTNLVAYVEQIGAQETHGADAEQRADDREPGHAEHQHRCRGDLQISASDRMATRSPTARADCRRASRSTRHRPHHWHARQRSRSTQRGRDGARSGRPPPRASPGTSHAGHHGADDASELLGQWRQRRRPALSWAASTDNVGVTGYIIFARRTARRVRRLRAPPRARAAGPTTTSRRGVIHLRGEGIRRGRQPERPHGVAESSHRISADRHLGI